MCGRESVQCTSNIHLEAMANKLQKKKVIQVLSGRIVTTGNKFRSLCVFWGTDQYWHQILCISIMQWIVPLGQLKDHIANQNFFRVRYHLGNLSHKSYHHSLGIFTTKGLSLYFYFKRNCKPFHVQQREQYYTFTEGKSFGVI